MPDVQSECCRMMRESIQYALDNHDEALAYAMQFARDMEPRLAEKFVGMYVNHYTVDAGDVIPEAAQKLLDLGYEAGLISKARRSRIHPLVARAKRRRRSRSRPHKVPVYGLQVIQFLLQPGPVASCALVAIGRLRSW